MSATLEHGVQGTPDDVIDVDMASIPLPTDEAEQLKESLQSGTQTAQSERTGNADSEESSGDPSNSPQSVESVESDRSNEDSIGEAAGGGSDTTKDTGRGETGMGPVPGTDGLLALLRQLLERLVGLLGGLLLVGAVCLAAVKWDWLSERLREILPTADSSTGTGETESRSLRSPENQIEELWTQMLSVAGVSDRPTQTPRERAAAAVEAGLRPKPVHELTQLFEDVRYGDRPVTADEVERASAYLRGTVSEDND